jgi:hypothetical protein
VVQGTVSTFACATLSATYFDKHNVSIDETSEVAFVDRKVVLPFMDEALIVRQEV